MLKRFKTDNNTFYQIVRTIRPRQWVKNLVVFAAIVFGGRLFEIDAFWASVGAFFAFSFASAFTYILNDTVDKDKDKLHPIKCNRPIASGKLGVKTALSTGMVFLSFSIFISASVNEFLFYIIVAYLALQFAYSFSLKNFIIIDALAVSFGFILRLFSGGVASGTSISSWLVLTVIAVSLLLAFGKRRAERTVLAGKNLDLKTRNTLKNYPDSLLDSMISMSASFTIISYAIFTFQTSPSTETPALISNYIPEMLSAPKWMMLTIPLVIYGVGRYLYVIYENKNAESPERALFQDRPLLYTVALWGATIIFFYYVLGTVNL
jgi:4-hydroxybenzoate polyprenyltransferase